MKILLGNCFRNTVFGASIIALILFGGKQSLSQSEIILESNDCDAEYDNRSVYGESSTNIQFINEEDYPVKVYWLDYEGQRQHYFDLEPGEVYNQQTFVTHPWIVTEAEEKSCIDMFFPSYKPGIAIID